MLKSSVSIFGNRMIVRLLNLLLAVLIARALGPELQGVVSFLVVQAGLMTTLSILGLDTGLIYHLRRLRMPESEFLRRAIPLAILGSVLSCLGLWVLYPLPAAGLTRFSPTLIGLLCAIFVSDVFGSLLRNLFLARDQVSRFNRFELTQSLLLLALTGLGLWAFPRQVVPVLLALVISRMLTVIWMALSNQVALGRWTLEGSRPILAYSLQPWLGNLFSLLTLRLDTILVSWFIGMGQGVTPADLGLYTICVLAISRAQDVQVIIQTAFFPAVASLEANEGILLTSRVYRLTTPLYVLLALAVCLGGYPVLWAFGPEYVAAWPTLCVLALGLLVIRANIGVLALWFSSNGWPMVPTLVNLSGVCSNLVLNLLWIPRYGILGAALATTVSALGMKLLMLGLFLRRADVRWHQTLLLRPSEVKDSLRMVREAIRRRMGGMAR
jgi:O-antigen/teichoic acid export membrane protein